MEAMEDVQVKRSEQQSIIHQLLSNESTEAKEEMYLSSVSAQDQTFWPEIAGMALNNTGM